MTDPTAAPKQAKDESQLTAKQLRVRSRVAYRKGDFGEGGRIREIANRKQEQEDRAASTRTPEQTARWLDRR